MILMTSPHSQLGTVEHACSHQPLEGRGRRITTRLKSHWWFAWQGDCSLFSAPLPFSSRSGKKPRETVWCVGFSSQNKGNRKLSAILVNHGLLAVLAWTTKEFHMVRSVLAAAPGCEVDSFCYLVNHSQVVPRKALVNRQWVPELRKPGSGLSRNRNLRQTGKVKNLRGELSLLTKPVLTQKAGLPVDTRV